MKIGDFIYHFDSNRRKYHSPMPGETFSRGGPIYREHWKAVVITGETKLSWVTSYGKCPKRGGTGWALSEDEVNESVWDHENRYRIGSMVQSHHRVSTNKLRQVAALIGYQEEKE